MDRRLPVKEDGVIMRGRTYLLGGVAVAAVLLQVPALPGDSPAPDQTRAAAAHCDRTLSPHGRVTIPMAVHARERIGTLCLRGGVYRTDRDVWLRRHGMTIMSVPGEHATWHGRIIVRARNVTLARLKLDGTGRGSSSLPSPTISGSGFTLRDSDVTNHNGICVHPLEYKRLTPLHFTIERNRIHNCGRRPRTNHDHGVYVASGTGVIRDNLIFDNADRGVQLYPEARGVRIYRNTIDGNGEGIIFSAAAARNVASNNLITNSRARWNVEYFQLRGRGNEVLSNCVRAGDSRDDYYRQRGGIVPGIERFLKLRGNETATVEYRARARGDFRTKSRSPVCKGMGAPDDVTRPPGG